MPGGNTTLFNTRKLQKPEASDNLARDGDDAIVPGLEFRVKMSRSPFAQRKDNSYGPNPPLLTTSVILPST